MALLAVLIAVLVGNGAWIWRQLGANSHAGRAVFFGLLLLCVYWCVVVYTFKLSLSVRLSPRNICVTRGPWSVEIRWSDVGRLMERIQTLDGRRYRWIIAMARDGRRISVREDAIGDYARFRREAYERYRVWRDHGGTWGTTGTGPFTARETVRDEAEWWAISAVMIALPGLYFAELLPETNPLGYALIACALLCLVMLARTFMQRKSYTIDRAYIESRTALTRTRLSWAQVSKVERTRHPVGGVILTGVKAGRLILRLASRGDSGIRSFAWAPRVPEYLTLRGGGRHARVRLHRLMQPDELLAWIEFYDTVRRAPSPSRARATAGAATVPVSQPVSADALTSDMPDMSEASGPLDPWGAGRQGEPSQPAVTAKRSTQGPGAPRTPAAASQPTFDAPGQAAETPVNVSDAFAAFADHVASSVARQSAPSAPDHTDLPTMRTTAVSQDDAWLRETGAMQSVVGDAPAESAPPAAMAWDHQPEAPRFNHPMREPIQEQWQPEPPAAHEPAAWSPQPEPHQQRQQRQQRSIEQGGWHAEPAGAPWDAQPAAPRYDVIDESNQWEPEPSHNVSERDQWQAQPERSGSVEGAERENRWWPERERRQPTPAPHGATHAPHEAPVDEGRATGVRWDSDWRPEPQATLGEAAPIETHAAHDVYGAFESGDEGDWVDAISQEDDEAASEVETPRPWREENWQPPALPRFGPSAPRPDETSNRD